MGSELFHGYNCFATAVGQHLINLHKYNAMETLVLRWTFDCNKYWLTENVWPVGACVEAVDYLLQYDLKLIEGIKISECKVDSYEESFQMMKEQIQKLGSHVVLVDFYYLKSIDWKRMERFGYFPKHLPHFICVIGIEDENVIYQDPMYKYVGKMSFLEFETARKISVCGVDHVGTYYNFEFMNSEKKYSFIEKIEYQLRRYIEHQQYNMIVKFKNGLSENYEYFLERDNYDWAFNFYLALESVTLQRQNFMLSIRNLYPEESSMVMNLVRSWIKIRNNFNQIRIKRNARILKEIIIDLQQITLQEEEICRRLLERIQNVIR